MNTPTKEELDEAIRFHREFGSISKRTMDKVVIPILTKYRDGELVEKPNIEVLVSRIADASYKCMDWQGLEITGFSIDEFEQRVKGILTPPTNQTEKT